MMYIRLVFLVIIMTSSIGWSKTCKDYLMVIDAGSSGSRLYLYHHKIPTDHQSIAWQLLFDTQHEPGLHTLQETMIPQYIDRLWHPLTQYMQDQKLNIHCKIPTYFLGTGGMRTLSYKQSQSYYKRVKQAISDNFTMIKNRTLSGAQEAIYAWVAVNGVKQQHHISPSKTDHTWAALDLGGATAQVSFTSHQANYTLHWNGKRFDLYAKSLAWGQDRVRLHPKMTKICAISNAPWPHFQSKAIHKHPTHVVECQKQVEVVLKSIYPKDDLLPIPHTLNVMATGVYAFHRMALTLDLDASWQMVQKKQDEMCQLSWESIKQQTKTPAIYLFNFCLTSALIRSILTRLEIQANQTMLWAYKQYQQVISWPLGVALCHDKCTIQKLPH